MPQRTFSGLDIDNFLLVLDNYWENTHDVAAFGTDFNSIQVIVGASMPPGSGFVDIRSVADVIASGDFDFTTFPEIPPTAVINNVKMRWSGNIYAIITGVSTAPPQTVTAVANIFVNTPEGNYLDVNPGGSANGTYSQDQAASHSLASSEQEHDFPVPLTYAEFVTQFGTLWFQVDFNFDLHVGSSADAEGNYSGTFDLVALELIVEYTDAPIPADYVIEDAEIPKKTGDVVKISGPTGLTGITEVQVNLGGGTIITIPKYDFYWTSPTELWFYMPPLGSFEGEPQVIMIPDGTQFDGAIPLGALTIYFEDTSGLYKIVKNKKTDTKYNPERDGETTEVKIPDPMGRTGYIDG